MTHTQRSSEMEAIVRSDPTIAIIAWLGGCLCYDTNMRTPFYTGAGDDGNVRFGGKKIGKDEPVFALLGELDMLNSVMGWAGAEAARVKFSHTVMDVAATLEDMQQTLFIAQAEVASVGLGHAGAKKQHVAAEHTKRLEEVIAGIDDVLPKLKHFVLPGGCELASRLEIARARARATERAAAAFSKTQPLSGELLQFLNRLSSALFALARSANHFSGTPEKPPRYGGGQQPAD